MDDCLLREACPHAAIVLGSKLEHVSSAAKKLAVPLAQRSSTVLGRCGDSMPMRMCQLRIAFATDEVKMGPVKRLCNLACAIACVLAIAACSSVGYSIVDLAPEINATWDKSTLALAVGDVVKVAFPFKPEWNHEARVRSDGTASFLLVDSISVAGMTAAELDDRLSELYREKTASATDGVEVTIDVLTGGGAVTATSDGQSVYVVGEVIRPGALSVVGRSLTLFEAIADAGGHIKRSANLRNTVLVRRIASTGEMKSWRLDADIYSWGKVPAIMLQARDVVFVPNTAVDEIDIWIDQYIRLMLPFPNFTPTQSL